MIVSCWLYLIMDNVNPDISSSSHHVDTYTYIGHRLESVFYLPVYSKWHLEIDAVARMQNMSLENWYVVAVACLMRLRIYLRLVRCMLQSTKPTRIT